MVKRYFLLGIILLVVVFVTGCNFLLSPLHGRENPNDWNAQIYDIFASQLTEDTIKVSFPWRNLDYNYDDDETIEEAMLVYSIGKSLPIRTVPIPPESGGSYGFSFSKGTHLYSKEISGLSEGDEIWFALYPRMGLRWLAPLYEKIEVRDPADIAVVASAGPFYPDGGSTMMFDGWINELQAGDPYTIDGSNGVEQYLLLRFDIPDSNRIRCTNALLSLPVSNTSTNIGNAFPIISPYIEHYSENIRFQLIDYNNGDSFIYGDAGDGTADITNAINAAIRYGSNTIIVTIEPGVSESSQAPDFGSEFLTISYEQY